MSDSTEIPASSLTTAGKTAIIVAAFLGWFFAGMHLGITSLAMGSAAKDLLIFRFSAVSFINEFPCRVETMRGEKLVCAFGIETGRVSHDVRPSLPA